MVGGGGPATHRDLLRATVTAGGVRRDLVLPSRVPVVELVPEVVALLGVAGDDGEGGWTVVRVDGQPLHPDTGLLAQGVHDGEVLSLVTTAELEALGGGGAGSRRHDDVAEAVADVVAGLGSRWGARESTAVPRLASAWSALLVLGAVGTAAVRHPGPWVATVAAATAALMLLLGGVLARVRHDTPTAIGAVLTATPYAATSALTLVPGDRLGWSLAGAGCALAGAGWVGRVAVGQGHWLLPVPVVVGLAAVGVGAGHALSGVDVASTAMVLVVAAVVGARFVPWLGLAVSGSSLVLPGPPGREVSETRVRRSVRRVRDLVVGVRVGVVVVVVLSAPLLVGRGAAGLGILGAAAGVTVLGARRLVLRLEVLTGVVGGGLALVAGVVWALVLHPGWAPGVTAAAGGSLVLALVAVLVPPRAGARLDQLLDLLEGLCLGSLLPLLVVAAGLAAAVRGAVG